MGFLKLFQTGGLGPAEYRKVVASAQRGIVHDQDEAQTVSDDRTALSTSDDTVEVGD